MTRRMDSRMFPFVLLIALLPPDLSLKGGALSVLEYEKGSVLRTTRIAADAPFAVELDRLLKQGTWKPSLVSYAPGKIYVRRYSDEKGFSVNVYRDFLVVNHKGIQKTRKLDEGEYERLYGLLMKSR